MSRRRRVHFRFSGAFWQGALKEVYPPGLSLLGLGTTQFLVTPSFAHPSPHLLAPPLTQMPLPSFLCMEGKRNAGLRMDEERRFDE